MYRDKFKHFLLMIYKTNNNINIKYISKLIVMKVCMISSNHKIMILLP